MKPSKKRLRKLIREERASSKMYRRYGLPGIARDERKHARKLKRLLSYSIFTFLFCISLVSAITLTVNDTTEVGIVKPYFYGVNTHGAYLTSSAGTTTSTTNHQNMYNLSNMNIIRLDSHFDGAAGATGENSFFADRVGRYSYLANYSKAHGYKLLISINYMPSFLANITSAEAVCDSNNKTCPPTNYTLWGNMVVNFLKAISCDASTCIAEVWNEPEAAGMFLSNLSTSVGNMSIRSKYYNLIYNATYDALKKEFPTMAVGGMGFIGDNADNGPLVTGFLSNFSNSMDFVSFHRYLQVADGVSAKYDAILATTISNVLANCTAYTANCTNIYISEFNYNNATFMNSTSQIQAMQIALAEEYVLNHYPANISLVGYEWADSRFQYFNDSTNTTYPPYNVTRDFASHCPPGSIVYASTSDDSDVKAVTCKDGSKYNLIIINSENAENDVTIDYRGLDTTRMRASNIDGDYFAIPANGQQDATLDPYEILYLSAENCPDSLVLASDRVTCVAGIQSSCLAIISNFSGIIVIVGLLLTIVLIAAVIGVLLSSFGVIPDIEITENMDLKTVLIAVAIVSIVAILIIFVIYMFEVGLCPAFGG